VHQQAVPNSGLSAITLAGIDPDVVGGEGCSTGVDLEQSGGRIIRIANGCAPSIPVARVRVGITRMLDHQGPTPQLGVPQSLVDVLLGEPHGSTELARIETHEFSTATGSAMATPKDSVAVSSSQAIGTRACKKWGSVDGYPHSVSRP